MMAAFPGTSERLSWRPRGGPRLGKGGMRILTTFMFGLSAAVLATGGAPAQDVQRIAAIVNEEVVTIRDLELRIDLVISSTRFQDSPDNRRRLRNQVLRQLVDERLQMAEAKRLGVTVAPADIDRQLGNLARQNNMSRDQFDDVVKQTGIDMDALTQQITAETAWGRIIQLRLRPLAKISDEEIDDGLTKYEAARGQPEALVGEILLSVDVRDQEEEALRAAQRLVDQIKAGANFSAVARQFSAGATAASGGDIGWLLPGQLSPEIEAIVQSLEVGQVSEPVRSFGGYAIMTVRERRQALAPDPLSTRVTLSQFVAPHGRAAGAEAVAEARQRASAVAAVASGCEDLDRRGRDANAPTSGRLGTFALRDLPPEVRDIVAALPPGRASQPFQSDQGFRVVMVCERVEPPQSKPPTRADIQGNLEARRVALLAQRYLRNLRRDAFVEIR